MSGDNITKVSVTKTHGIRRGEPKRPESWIEMPGMVPEVPEVSLCFNQEKSKPFQSNRISNFQVAENVLDHHHQRQQQNEMLHRNQYESYNTWKAKNAQALHNITGGLERIEPGTKRAPSAKRSAGLIRKQNSGKEMNSPLILSAKYSFSGTSEHVNSTQQNDSSPEYSSLLNDNCTQLQTSTSNKPVKIYPVGHKHTGHPVHKHSFPQHLVRDSMKESQQTEDILIEPTSPSSNLRNYHSCKDRLVENIPLNYQLSGESNHNSTPIVCVPSYCNKLQCPCEKQKAIVNSLHGNYFVNENPKSTEESRANNMQFVDPAKFYSPQDVGLINNHLSSLSHIISIQKEQISILCQEMSSQKILMSAILEEVKQIHAAVSPNIQISHDTSQGKKKSCQSCTCEHKNDQGFINDEVIRNETYEDSIKNQIKQDPSASKQPPISPDDVEKRSVGVMTSSLDNIVHQTVPVKEKDKSVGVKGNVRKAKKYYEKAKAIDSPSPNKNKKINQKERIRREEKRKRQSSDIQTRKNMNDVSNESNQSEDSFLLDEAAVVIRTETEQGDISPDVSIHVNMPDYSASSAESDTSDSSDNEDEGQISGSEGESSDPQIGWTFYDRVVGQVNNMLKKTGNDPRQEYNTPNQRKNAGNVLHQCNGDYETENNWSKRVTFDGLPLEDSDTNGINVPRYHHFRTNQDYRMAGGPERMQDFLMCDYANGGNNLSLVNGSTNVSFATYRYYQRHQLLPPPPPMGYSGVPDKVCLDPPQMKKKKTKSRKNEKTRPVSQNNFKRSSGGPPSNILDVSALKHQPKLF